MRNRSRKLCGRREVAWYAAGALIVQLALGAGVEWIWPTVRDPDFCNIERIVRARAAERPEAPLVVVLGTSRTLGALLAERLNHPESARAPLVINAGVAGGGTVGVIL